MDTKKTGDYMLRNEMWMIPVRPSRWRTVLDAVADAARARGMQHSVSGNILDHARLHARRAGK